MTKWATGLLIVIAALTRAEDSVPKVKEPELRQELLNRAKADQAARTALIEWTKKNGMPEPKSKPKPELERLDEAVAQADRENSERLGTIIAKHGWPTNSLVGKVGANAAWLLVQHADANPKLQRKCLDLMTKLPKTEVSQTNLAYLTDRVLLAEGKMQIYGTQFTSTNGKWEPRLLEDPANVDKRRADVGLKPFAEYAKSLEALYGSPKK